MAEEKQIKLSAEQRIARLSLSILSINGVFALCPVAGKRFDGEHTTDRFQIPWQLKR